MIEDCQFTATGTGYGIYKNAAGNLTVTGCRFVSLSTAIGTECAWSSLTITGNDFTGCTEALGLTGANLASGETETIIEKAVVANNTNVNEGMINVH